ncbi:MAG: hypothetical protein WBV94_06795 [Blastocatellia bacterium]
MLEISVSAILTILIRFPPTILQSKPDPYWLMPSLLGFQAIAIVTFLVLIPEPLTNTKLAERASKAAQQFRQAWNRLWFFWLILYVGLAAHELWVIKTAGSIGWFVSKGHLNTMVRLYPTGWPLSLVGINLLNNLQTMALFMCYLVVSRKTVEAHEDKSPLPWLKGVAVLIIITGVEVFLTMVVKMPIDSSPVGAPELFRWLSGLGAGVALALLIGRLDSIFIGLHTWVVGLIYFYAVIQPGWEAFPEKPEVKLILINLALFLKILFFLLIYWLFKSGVLLFYLHSLGQIDKDIISERRDFLRKVQSPTPRRAKLNGKKKPRIVSSKKRAQSHKEIAQTQAEQSINESGKSEDEVLERERVENL